MTDEAEVPISQNFFARYWRGEFSLPVSYWLINWAASILAGVAIHLFAGAVGLKNDYHPLALFIGVAGVWMIACSAQVWQLVGLWRSAGNYLAETTGGKRIWAYLARIAVIGAVLSNLSALLTTGLPQIAEVSKILFAHDPDLPDYAITLSEDGNEIHVKGGFKYGLAKDLRQRIEFAPHARIVVFDSIGGRIGEAESVYDLLVEKKLSTVVNRLCASACALAFMGGDRRWLGVEGRIGLHAADFVGMSKRDVETAQRDFERKIAIRTGVPASFFAKAHAVDHKDIWYPPRDVLLDNRVLTARLSEAPSSVREFDAMARDVETAIRKILPRRVDSVTDLVQFDVRGNVFIYTLAIDPGAVSRAVVRDHAKALEDDVRERICQQEQVRKMMNLGVVYRYRHVMGRESTAVVVFDISTC